MMEEELNAEHLWSLRNEDSGDGGGRNEGMRAGGGGSNSNHFVITPEMEAGVGSVAEVLESFAKDMGIDAEGEASTHTQNVPLHLDVEK